MLWLTAAQARVILNPLLGNLIAKGILSTGSVIQVGQFDLLTDLHAFVQRTIVILTDIQVIQGELPFQPLNPCPLCVTAKRKDAHQKEPVPLIGHAVYLPLFSDDDRDSLPGEFGVSQNPPSSVVALNWAEGWPDLLAATASRSGILIGRIGKVSKLISFGLTKTGHRSPFQFWFELSTCVMSRSTVHLTTLGLHSRSLPHRESCGVERCCSDCSSHVPPAHYWVLCSC